ncbi:MAG: uroporphyrinogen decarboxylase family protein, partial [Candidatus Bathyarchaeia archaeon]
SEEFKQKATFYSPTTSPFGAWGMGPAWCIPHPNNVVEDEWGIKRKLGATGKYWHFVYHPLQDLDSVDEYEFPDIDAPGRFETAKKQLKKWGDEYFNIGGIPGFFEWAWYLRGFNKFITDLYTNPKFVNELLDKLLEYNLELGTRLIELGVDSIGSGEDTASQTGLFISPELWRKYFKPRYKRLYDGLKKKGDVFIFYHSDGNIEKLIPDLIDVGVDILNPIQPDCMDPAKIKKLYGSEMTFDGTISVQSTLPFGSVKDVEREVIKRIKTVGYDGGLILGPTHIVGYDVPLENILALYETAKKCKI